MKRMLKRILVALLVLILLAVAGFGVLYAGRLRTVNSIEQITAYDDYNLYRMDVTYDYSIDDVINYGITDNQSMIDAILKETLPLLPIRMKAPQFGCSAFGTVLDRHIVMGRTYDFKRDTSAMQAITNFYGCYAYLVKPNQRNGIYGHGKERYDAIMEVLAMRDPDGDIPADIAWKALQAAAQDPSPNDVTSNTQWSLVYDDTDLTAQIVIRRKWGDVIHYDLNTNEIDG